MVYKQKKDLTKQLTSKQRPLHFLNTVLLNPSAKVGYYDEVNK